MKILFLGADYFDYLQSMMLHGFRSLYNAQVVDFPKNSPTYQTYPVQASLHGNGFTAARTLPEANVNRDLAIITEQIRNQWFDCVVYPVVKRARPLWEEVTRVYPASKILMLDGEDSRSIPSELVPHGQYFKRELVWDDPTIHPIGFSFPLEKSVFDLGIPLHKTQKFSQSAPPGAEDIFQVAYPPTDGYPKVRDFTYFAHTESEYYGDYRRSLFGITMRKGGWDCCRHYEIIFNACLPFFYDVAECPPRTLTHLPKDLLLKIRQMPGVSYKRIDDAVFPTNQYIEYAEEMRDHALTSLTTTAMARYVLSRVE